MTRGLCLIVICIFATIILTLFFISACLSPNIKTDKLQLGITKFRVTNPNASFFDIKARMEILRNMEKKEIENLMQPSHFPGNLKRVIDENVCSPVMRPSPVGYLRIRPLGMFYTKEQIQNYRKEVEPLDHFRHTINYLAAMYVVTGHNSYAKCVLTILNEWAENQSLVRYEFSRPNNMQAAFDAEWTACSAAFAYSITRHIPLLDQEYKNRVEHWFKNISNGILNHDYGEFCNHNNHLYWRGLLATIVGVVSTDNEMFKRGLSIYVQAINAMDRDGSWPLEMERGERAIHYQNYSILPLIYIAEVADRQGYNLYNISINGKTIHLAIKFLTHYLKYRRKPDDSDFRHNQNLDFLTQGFCLTWVDPYYNRFDKEGWVEYEWLKHKAIYDKYPCGFAALFYRRMASIGTSGS